MNVLTACRDVKELLPAAQLACNMFLRECKKRELPALITETYCSQERQNYLYEQGRIQSRTGVTWTKNSRHTGRCAWDICQNVRGQEYSDKAFFKKCGEVAKELGITWGGEWSTPDLPHFEVKSDWKPKEVNEVVKHYEKVVEVPTWARPMVQDMIRKGCFANPNKLHLSDDMLRIMAVIGRYQKSNNELL